MPELPDIVVLVQSMQQALAGRRIAEVAIHQPKCLNVTPGEFAAAAGGRTIRGTAQRGKWALLPLDSGDLLALNLGMGGEACLHRAHEQPSPTRERAVLRFADGDQLWIHFWWFGHLHLVPGGDHSQHPQLARLGHEPLAPEFTADCLRALLAGRRGPIKKYLLDQSLIAGIGNVYVQDILWRARLHPQHPARDLTPGQVASLHAAIQTTLQEGIRWGGGPGEKDVWGREGAYPQHYQVAYRPGQPCPACGTLIEQLRVGATTSFVCPTCQPASPTLPSLSPPEPSHRAKPRVACYNTYQTGACFDAPLTSRRYSDPQDRPTVQL
ncbi:MAG: Fpg/Nei family DNA glycosylase [Anaerolineae bacterium]